MQNPTMLNGIIIKLILFSKIYFLFFELMKKGQVAPKCGSAKIKIVK